jgi:hypothetical protein
VRHLCVKAFFALAASALLGGGAAGQTIRVGSITDARFGTSWTLDGSSMSTTRAKLLATSNFGSGGTVIQSIQITDTGAAVGSVTPALLSGFDVFFVGWLDDANVNHFTPAEITSFQGFVASGGYMIVTCDDPSHAAVCNAFGLTVSNSAVNPMLPTPAGTANGAFNGPFGVVASFNMALTQGFFSGAVGGTILAQDSSVSPKPVMVLNPVSGGRVILMADVDILSNNTLSSGTGIANGNDRLLGNLFALANGGGGARQVPAVSIPGLLALGIALAGLGAITLRMRA